MPTDQQVAEIEARVRRLEAIVRQLQGSTAPPLMERTDARLYRLETDVADLKARG